jgi:dolichol-phosphate mannosyltransferase
MSDPKIPGISIILPTYNEAETIVPIINDILKYLPDGEVIVVDDNSPDGTADIVAAIGDPRVVLVRRLLDCGLASATLRGIIEAKANIIGWIDADAWMMPPVLPKMAEQLKDFDIVVASRFVPGGGDSRMPIRILASRLLNGFARLVLGGDIHDYSSNFVVIRRKVLDAVLPVPTGYGEFFIEMLYRARLKGLRITEVPYVLDERTQGISKSKPNIRGFLFLGMRYGLRILMARVKGTNYD